MKIIEKIKNLTKGKKILLIILICLGIVVVGSFITSVTNHDVNAHFVNGTDTESFTYEIGYIYRNTSVVDNFTITVDTIGNWSVSEVDGNLVIDNEDNNTINDVSITKDGLEYGINGINPTESDVENSVSIFEVVYSGDSTLVKLYQ